MRPRALLAPLALAAVLAGCGGGGGDENAVGAITLSPATVRLVPGGLQSFTAVLDGGTQSVTWSVATPADGTITQEGRYTAPTISGTYTVRATLRNDTTKSGTATVTVDSGVAIAITGASTVGTGTSTTYTATVTGASATGVTWTASAGTIGADGRFTAPATPGAVTITARSVADAGKTATFTVNVAAAIAVRAPAAGSLAVPGSRLTFTALLDGIASNDVTWTASAGTIDGAGKWIAPAAGTATITATRRDGTRPSASVDVQTVADLDAIVTFEGRAPIVFDLRGDVSPNHVANFVSLINEGFYDGIVAHRYEPGFVIQWGDPLTKTLPLDDPSIGTGGPGYTIPFETNPLLNARYSLAMARSQSRDSGGSQVYVNLADNTSLNGEYVVFGATRSGQAVVDALRRGDKITSIRVVRP